MTAYLLFLLTDIIVTCGLLQLTENDVILEDDEGEPV
jgi:hypothetical protein